MMRLAADAFRLLRLSGLARVDFRVKDRSGQVFINEVNSLPGFTSISMYPRLMELAGVPLPAQLDRLVQLAMRKQLAAANQSAPPQAAVL